MMNTYEFYKEKNHMNINRSMEEKMFLLPQAGHHWLFKFGNAGDGTSWEKVQLGMQLGGLWLQGYPVL